MSEEFNIFEDEKVQEIVWDKIIQDFSTSQMNIDNFCMMKEISKEELQSRIQDKMTSFSEAELEKNLVFHEDDIVELDNVINQVPDEEDRIYYFEKFCAMMRLSYTRKLYDMKAWSDEMAALKRERAKSFLQYAQNLIRENFILNLRQSELNYMHEDEEAFSAKFSKFVNSRNVEGIMNELEVAEKDITQNVSSKMVFFDLSLKLIMLLKAGNPE